MEIKIESGIPIPSQEANTRGLTAALRAMKIGDSFEVPISTRAALYPAIQRLGIKIISRKLNDVSIRVWRIE